MLREGRLAEFDRTLRTMVSHVATTAWQPLPSSAMCRVYVYVRVRGRERMGGVRVHVYTHTHTSPKKVLARQKDEECRDISVCSILQ